MAFFSHSPVGLAIILAEFSCTLSQGKVLHIPVDTPSFRVSTDITLGSQLFSNEILSYSCSHSILAHPSLECALSSAAPLLPETCSLTVPCTPHHSRNSFHIDHKGSATLVRVQGSPAAHMLDENCWHGEHIDLEFKN